MSYTIELPGEAGAKPGKVTATAGRYTIELPSAPPQQDPSLADRVLASPVGGLLKGANSIVEGGAELLPHALGNVTSLGGMAPNQVSDFLFDESRRVRQMNAEGEAAYEAARQRAGATGTDVPRIAGNVAGGVALGLAVPGSIPATTAGRAAYGAAIGGGSGALAPTGEVDDQKFAEQKAMQAGAGAAVGAAATPVAGWVTDKLGPVLDKVVNRVRGGPKMSEAMILDRIRFELGKENIEFGNLPAAARRQIAREVSDSLRKGVKLDAAALSRKIDLDAFGGGTQGQITRDPAQWNREFNLRQVENAGEPLVDQAMRVRQETGRRLGQYGGASAGDKLSDGTAAIESLQAADAPIRRTVDELYEAARGAAGRESRLKPYQFTSFANDALDEGQLGAVLPKQIRGLMNRVATGELPLTVNTASQLQSILSGQARMLRRGGNNEAALAIDKVSDALRATDLEDGAEPAARAAFNAAKQMAAARFATQKAAPAMKAALDESISPEKFLDRYVIGGDYRAVLNLSEVMPQEGQQAVRNHIAKYLQDKAFGTNVSGDGPMAVERYSKALKEIGRGKLRAFFPEEVVDDFYRIARVNSYVTQQPAGVTPNRSGTAGALFNLVQRIQGVPVAVPVIRGMVNQGRASAALSPQVPSEAIPVLTPGMRRLLPVVPVAGGVFAGSQE